MALVLSTTPSWTDDIDVYVAPSGSLPPEDAPKVMFTIDWRPNLYAELCHGVEFEFLI